MDEITNEMVNDQEFLHELTNEELLDLLADRLKEDATEENENVNDPV